MKVLFLTNVPSPYKVNFFGELGKLCDLTVLYEIGTSKERDAKWYVSDHTTYKSVCLNGIRIRTDDALCFNVTGYLKDRSYDIVVLSGYSTPTTILAIEYLSLNKIPFIMTVDGGMPREEKGIMLKLKKHLISKARGYASPSESTDRLLVSYGANAEKIHRYPFTSVMEQDIIKRIPSASDKQLIRNKLGMQESKIVLSVGQFIHRKGYDILLKAAINLPSDTGLYIAGGVPTKEYLDCVKENDLRNVHFVNFMTKSQLSEYYLASDLFVIPTRFDVWGLVVNEAMAHGLPVITTDKCVAGLELIVNGGNGYLVHTDDAEQLLQKMRNLLENEELCAKMREGAISTISHYTVENMSKQYAEMFYEFT